MRVPGIVVLSVALTTAGAPALASDTLPETGSAKLAAYQVCHSLAAVEMEAAGSQTSTECNGIVRNLDGQKSPDNLAIHCLEESGARREGYKYSGACVQTDADGDKLFMTYEGSKSGRFQWIGGTGKFKDVAGEGTLSVLVAPGGGGPQFAYTLNLDVSWTRKAK